MQLSEASPDDCWIIHWSARPCLWISAIGNSTLWCAEQVSFQWPHCHTRSELLRSHRSLSGDLLNYWCCHLMRDVGVCVCTGDTSLFIKRFGMNTVKEKLEKRQRKMWVLGTGSHTSHPEPCPGPGWVLGCKWSPSATAVAQEVHVDGERQQRLQCQCRRPSIWLTVASLRTTWWLLKRQNCIQHNLSWSGIHRVECV